MFDGASLACPDVTITDLAPKFSRRFWGICGVHRRGSMFAIGCDRIFDGGDPHDGFAGISIHDAIGRERGC
jgi:hypothetical protein